MGRWALMRASSNFGVPRAKRQPKSSHIELRTCISSFESPNWGKREDLSMVSISVYFLFGTMLCAALVLFAIARYNPVGRTEKQLALALAHFDRVHQDALTIVQAQNEKLNHKASLMYVSSFSDQCASLRSIPDANFVLLGEGAIMTREQLLVRLDAWNRHAGSMATSESILAVLESMAVPARDLKHMVPVAQREEAEKEIQHEILIQAVAPTGGENEWTH